MGADCDAFDAEVTGVRHDLDKRPDHSFQALGLAPSRGAAIVIFSAAIIEWYIDHVVLAPASRRPILVAPSSVRAHPSKRPAFRQACPLWHLRDRSKSDPVAREEPGRLGAYQ